MGEGENNMTEIVATNVIDSWQPERRPTATPRVRVNKAQVGRNLELEL